MLTRRTWLAALAGSFHAGAETAPAAALSGTERRYRVDAVISFLSVPIFSRAGVGSGHAVQREVNGAGGRMLTLGFASGSWPERARGLNRLGYIHEHNLERNAALCEADYFGFMTSSPEQSLEQARKALAATGAEVWIAAIHGSMAEGRRSCALARLAMGQDLNWRSWRPLLPGIQRAAREAPAVRLDERPGEVARPFLYTLTRAMKQGPARAEYSYAYGVKLYTLHVEKQADPRTGAALRQRGLIRRDADLCRLTGIIRQPPSSQQSRFALWFDLSDASYLPLRVELQARSFLRLILETDPSLPGFEFPDWTVPPAGREGD